mgnify:CR=1 FL=1
MSNIVKRTDCFEEHRGGALAWSARCINFSGGSAPSAKRLLSLEQKNAVSEKQSVRFMSAGQVLMESLIAITIATVGLLGMFALLSRSLSLTRVVADRYVATYLAAEGIEVVKNLIDTNVIQKNPWNLNLASGTYEVDYQSGLQSYAARRLNYNEATGYYDYGSGLPTNFLRRVDVERLGRDEIRVNSVVSWISRGGADFEVNLEDHFLNWQQ